MKNRFSCIGKSHYDNRTYIHMIYETPMVEGMACQVFTIFDNNQIFPVDEIKPGFKCWYDITYNYNKEKKYYSIVRIDKVEDNQ